jgi:hypothetical protein
MTVQQVFASAKIGLAQAPTLGAGHPYITVKKKRVSIQGSAFPGFYRNVYMNAGAISKTWAMAT